MSGAPKVRAMQLISELEPHNRGAYGGCVGILGFNGSLNQAITILGICLGEQAIGEAFGGRLVNLAEVYHGVQTPVMLVRKDYIFEGLTTEIHAGRYHSWVVDRDTLPPCIEVIAESREGHIMALRHRQYDVRGIQFHLESVLTPCGKTIIGNWLRGNSLDKISNL